MFGSKGTLRCPLEHDAQLVNQVGRLRRRLSLALDPMLRRQALAGTLSLFGVAAIAAPPRSNEVFEAFFRQFGEAGRTYVLLESVLDASASPGASRSLIREFPVRQRKHRAGEFGSVSVRLLTEAEYVEIFSEGRSCAAGWSDFHSRFPDAKALLQFSAVRFTKGGTEAHVLAQISSACLASTVDRYRFLSYGALWQFATAENLGRA